MVLTSPEFGKPVWDSAPTRSSNAVVPAAAWTARIESQGYVEDVEGSRGARARLLESLLSWPLTTRSRWLWPSRSLQKMT